MSKKGTVAITYKVTGRYDGEEITLYTKTKSVRKSKIAISAFNKILKKYNIDIRDVEDLKIRKVW